VSKLLERGARVHFKSKTPHLWSIFSISFFVFSGCITNIDQESCKSARAETIAINSSSDVTPEQENRLLELESIEDDCQYLQSQQPTP
jgi:hypothetical protein